MILMLSVTVDWIDCQVVFSLFCWNNNLFSSRRIAWSTKSFSVTLASFWNWRWVEEAKAESCLILIYKSVKFSQITNVCNTSLKRFINISVVHWIFFSTCDLKMWLKTLFEFKKNTSILIQSDLMFQDMNITLHAHLYSKIKYCFSIMLNSSQNSCSVSWWYAALNNSNESTSQNWVL